MASNSNGETYMGDRLGTHEMSSGPRTRLFQRMFNFIRVPMEPTFAGLIISHGEMKKRMKPNHQSPVPKIQSRQRCSDSPCIWIDQQFRKHDFRV